MKKKTPIFALTCCAALVGTIFLITGCGSTSGYKQADSTGKSMDSFRGDIMKLTESVGTSLSSLSNITAQAEVNPRKPFQDFTKSVKSVESGAKKAGSRADSMQAKGAAYFDQWQKELASVNNPEIRKMAEQRKEKLTEIFDRLSTKMQTVKETFNPFLSDLQDLQTYFATDLTAGGIAAAKPLVEKAWIDGNVVKESLAGIVTELDEVSAALVPSKASK